MLKIKNLSISFKNDDKFIPVTEKVSFELKKGGTLGIVGESGCGKSVTVQAILGLLPSDSSKVKADLFQFDNKSLLNMTEKEWHSIRGNDISMVFQNPMTCLNPLMKCGQQILEAITLHQNLGKKAAVKRAVELLELMGLSDPKKSFNSYPHQLSGGMRQRVMIAMALACEPKILIADEPTTALDVTIQAQILKLIRELKMKMEMSLILITHDLGVVQSMVENLIVMYAGHIVEQGKTSQILKHPRHPYTQGLLESIPRLSDVKKRLRSIEGSVPIPENFPKGCRFFERCSIKEPSCQNLEYQLAGKGGHLSNCQFWDRI